MAWASKILAARMCLRLPIRRSCIPAARSGGIRFPKIPSGRMRQVTVSDGKGAAVLRSRKSLEIPNVLRNQRPAHRAVLETGRRTAAVRPRHRGLTKAIRPDQVSAIDTRTETIMIGDGTLSGRLSWQASGISCLCRRRSHLIVSIGIGRRPGFQESLLTRVSVRRCGAGHKTRHEGPLYRSAADLEEIHPADR